MPRNPIETLVTAAAILLVGALPAFAEPVSAIIGLTTLVSSIIGGSAITIGGIALVGRLASNLRKNT